MQIKRYEAKNMTEALRLIKDDLGAEAVILSAKDLRRENRLGISRKVGVEVTAAVDMSATAPAPPALRSTAACAAPAGERAVTAEGKAPLKQRGQMLLHTLYGRMNRMGRATAPQGNDHAVADARPPASEAGAHGSLEDETSPSFTWRRPVDRGGPGMGPKRSPRVALCAGALDLGTSGTHRVALIGNAGVGKTTTIAKLAARYACVDKEAVGLISLDCRRMAGFEQLRRYADIMGLPLETVRCEEDVPAALARLETCRLVLIDTPAVDPDDAEGLALLRSQFEALGDMTTLLTISAGSREADLQATAVRCADLAPDGVVITKTDLTRHYDDMVHFLGRRGMAVYYYSTGRRVPLDLTAATQEGLAERFVRSTPPAFAAGRGGHDITPGTAAHGQEAAEPTCYLANKSSDIFHRPECKWIRFINQANIVEFDSFADALNHRFKPCRYCNPQHLSITGMLSRESTAR